MSKVLRSREFDDFTGMTTEYWLDKNNPGKVMVKQSEDVQAILDYNKHHANERLNYSFMGKDQLMYPIATIPNTIVMKWLKEDGIDVYSSDPDMKKKVLRKLQDPDWRYLRTDNSKLIY